MKPRRKKTPTGRAGHPRIVGPSATLPASTSQPSLPPVVVGNLLSSPSLPHPTREETRVRCPKCNTLTTLKTCSICDTPVPQPYWRMRDDSVMRELTMKIIALRLGGMEDQDIAAHLKIKRESMSVYIWRAGKNGWLSDFNSAKDAIEYGLAHKVIRNLDEFLEARDKEVTLEVAKGTMFKQFAETNNDGAVHQTAISIKIEQPTTSQPLRAGTIGGAIIDVEPSDV